MNFNNSITLKRYADDAGKRFEEMQNRLSKIENSFQSRMNGKSMGGMIGSFIGTLLWVAAFIGGAILAREFVNNILLTVGLVVVMALMVFMFIDHFINFSYYGKISTYKNAISRLQSRVGVGRSSIKANHDAFVGAKAKGWEHMLEAASSIPGEATSIEGTMSGMESLKSGFINGAKNVFYYAAIIAITVVGCVALFPASEGIIQGISDGAVSGDVANILNIIATVIVLIGEIILARLVWSKTDCSVNNVTLLIIPLGPVALLALVAIVALVVILVIAIVQIVLYVLGIVIVGVIAFSCLCGG